MVENWKTFEKVHVFNESTSCHTVELNRLKQDLTFQTQKLEGNNFIQESNRAWSLAFSWS